MTMTTKPTTAMMIDFKHRNTRTEFEEEKNTFREKSKRTSSEMFSGSNRDQK